MYRCYLWKSKEICIILINRWKTLPSIQNTSCCLVLLKCKKILSKQCHLQCVSMLVLCDISVRCASRSHWCVFGCGHKCAIEHTWGSSIYPVQLPVCFAITHIIMLTLTSCCASPCRALPLGSQRTRSTANRPWWMAQAPKHTGPGSWMVMSSHWWAQTVMTH